MTATWQSRKDPRKMVFVLRSMLCSALLPTRMARGLLGSSFLVHFTTAHPAYGVSSALVGSPSFRILMRRNTHQCLAVPSNMSKRIIKCAQQRSHHYYHN